MTSGSIIYVDVSVKRGELIGIKRLTAVATVTLSVLFTACGREAEKSELTIYAMDTVMSLTVYGDDADRLTAQASARINELSSLWAAGDTGSEVGRLNNGEEVELSPETTELISFSLAMATQTDGALDIRLYPLMKEWGFTTGEYNVPEANRLNELLDIRGDIHISGSTLALPQGTEIDLGAVAKGYTGDILYEMLSEAGVTSAILDLGGNIHVIGGKPDGTPWRLGIKDPRADGNIGVLELYDSAAVTSGDYERYFEDDGTRYCHILDPKTGRPAANGLCSVTVVGKEGRLCDALSTALFVMGSEDAERYWRSHNDFQMILIEIDGDILITEGLEHSFTLSDGTNSKVQIIRR